MLAALVLVCSMAITPELADCNRDNAVGVLRLPEQVAMPGGCLKLGSARPAQTGMGRLLPPDERVKVLCVRSNRAGASRNFPWQPSRG